MRIYDFPFLFPDHGPELSLVLSHIFFCIATLGVYTW